MSLRMRPNHSSAGTHDVRPTTSPPMPPSPGVSVPLRSSRPPSTAQKAPSPMPRSWSATSAASGSTRRVVAKGSASKRGATSGTSGCTFPICPTTSASRSSTACRPASVADSPSERSAPARASTAALSSAARAAPTFFKQVVKLMRTPRSGPGQSTPLRSLLPLGRAHAGADAVRIAPRLRLRWCGQRQSTARPQGPAWRPT